MSGAGGSRSSPLSIAHGSRARRRADLAIVVVHWDDEHALALIGESVELASGPVIAQLRGGDARRHFVARVAERGISA